MSFTLQGCNKAIFYSVSIISFSIICILNVNLAQFPATTRELPTSYHHDHPIVLTWTSFFGSDLAKLLEKKSDSCFYKCDYTSDKRLLNESSLIVFHSRDFTDFPQTRPDQLKVLYNLESPANSWPSLFRNVPQNYFNLTATYRTDSDVYVPYGIFEKRSVKDDIREKVNNIVANKTKLVLQLVSNCETQSKREMVTEALEKLINITSYGGCFGVDCGEQCEEEAIKSHYFYLAFENSVCQDYVTEKFFRLGSGIVPVVLSREVIKNVAPPESFIAVDDFYSLKKLAEYLTYVARNQTLYVSYFDWMSTYEIKHFDFAVCDLCQAAHKKPNSKYDNAVEWWLNGTCLNRHTSDEVELSWISNYGLIVLLLIVFVAISDQDAH